jgi:hypothetical protein
LCCAIAFTLAVVTTMLEVYREGSWEAVNSHKSAILFVPRIWWGWQKLYLTSMPLTLGIVGLFAATLNWS